ncbi:putative uncharacterized protein [Staphylococcus sp. CAG:324]|nr:hypothetical protein [Staphylococcus sp.]CDC71338.1 putative uncharacterized protein [Staphylococcus sp. CAG:324]
MYYKVLAKCGHVGRNNYIIKCFYVKANDGEEAAKIVRQKPRVKHHHKDAIRDVIAIELEEYLTGLKIMEADMYFKVQNSSDQRLYNCVKQEDIYPEEDKKKYKKPRNGQRLRALAMEKEMKKYVQGGWMND